MRVQIHRTKLVLNDQKSQHCIAALLAVCIREIDTYLHAVVPEPSVVAVAARVALAAAAASKRA
jgi:hypothetical protein